MIAHRVAGVLAKEALDALTELLAPGDILLRHPVLARLQALRRLECRNLAGLRVVEGHVGDEIADHGECPKRRHRDGVGLLEGVHPGHAHQARTPIDLDAARPALAGLAVPADGEIGGLLGLDAVDDVEYDLTLLHLDVVVLEFAGAVRPAPEAELRHVAHVYAIPTEVSSSVVMYFFSSAASKSVMSSIGIVGTGCLVTSIWSLLMRQMRFTWRQSGLITGKSLRV